MVLMLVLTAFGLGAPLDHSAPADASTAAIRVVAAESGEPLPGALVDVRICDVTCHNSRLTTDDRGEVTIRVPPGSHLRLVIAHAEGRVAMNSYDAVSLPERVVMSLESSVRIGGIVTEPDGTPVAGARVELSRAASGAEARAGKSVPFEYPLRAITDEHGAWFIANAPRGLAGFRVTFKHSAFLDGSADANQAAAALQQGRFSMELESIRPYHGSADQYLPAIVLGAGAILIGLVVAHSRGCHLGAARRRGANDFASST